MGTKEDTGLICEVAENPKSFILAATLQTDESTALGKKISKAGK